MESDVRGRATLSEIARMKYPKIEYDELGLHGPLGVKSLKVEIREVWMKGNNGIPDGFY